MCRGGKWLRFERAITCTVRQFWSPTKSVGSAGGWSSWHLSERAISCVMFQSTDIWFLSGCPVNDECTSITIYHYLLLFKITPTTKFQTVFKTMTRHFSRSIFFFFFWKNILAEVRLLLSTKPLLKHVLEWVSWKTKRKSNTHSFVKYNRAMWQKWPIRLMPANM